MNMTAKAMRKEYDSLGNIDVPAAALYGAQTQRAVDNFPISGYRLSRAMICALGQIKSEAAKANAELNLIKPEIAILIQHACAEVIKGTLDEHFPVDIFQTGSGTSSNMNVNEVVAHYAKQINAEITVHPNDHVNFGQSSNDVFPTACRIAAYVQAQHHFLPAIDSLRTSLLKKGKEYANVPRTGRTHLMDAMPVTFEQIFSGYAQQLFLGTQRIKAAFSRLAELPLGGTAVGTGINTHPKFPALVASGLAQITKLPLIEATEHFEAQSTVDVFVELSGQIKTVAVSLMKIVNDLRWMNSGPNAGLGEIALPAVQPGSSIMPGKVNPVIEESVAMVCAHAIGCDTAVSIGGLSGNFELNVMQPMVIMNILEPMRLLSAAMHNLAQRSVQNLKVREKNVRSLLDKNPVLITALNPVIGYDLAAKIAKIAFSENRSLKEVALELSDLSKEELDRALNPSKLTEGGIV